MAGLTKIDGGQTACPKLEETLELILDESVGTHWLPIIAYVLYPRHNTAFLVFVTEF